MKFMVTLPNIIGLFVTAFISFFALRVFYPILDTILSLFSSGMTKTMATIAIWLVIFMVLYIAIWMPMFNINKEEYSTR